MDHVKKLEKNEYSVVEKNLLEELKNTKDTTIRNTIAIILSDLKCDSAIKILTSLIKEPKYYNCRGTLIYALEGLNSEKEIIKLLPFIYEGNYETKCNLYALVESKINVMSQDGYLDYNMDKQYELGQKLNFGIEYWEE